MRIIVLLVPAGVKEFEQINGAEHLPAAKRVPGWVMPLVRIGIIATDGFLAAGCFILAFKLRDGNTVLSGSGFGWSAAFSPYGAVLLFAVPLRIVMLAYQRAYNFTGAFEYTREAIKVFKATAIGTLMIVAWAFLFRGGFSFREFSYSRGVFIFDLLFALTAYTAFHLFVRAVQAAIRERGINLIPTVIVGSNAEAFSTIRELRSRRYLGYRVLGVISDDAPGDSIRLDDDTEVPVFGRVDQLAETIRKLEIQEVIITDDRIESKRFFDAMMAVGRRQKVEFRFAPSLFDLLPQKTSVDPIGVLPMVRLFREPLSEIQRFTKRLSDIIIAVTAGIFTCPIWLAAAIAVKLDSPGRIIFKQERVGMDGRVFLCFKFRTMADGADQSVHREAYVRNIRGVTDAEIGDQPPIFGKVKDDSRVTRVGKWLRRSSIDELPQLLNVIRGEMSIVGPRPPIPYEVENYQVWQRKRLDMKPGLTGLWQVSGRSRLTFEEMVGVDLYYIENWSLLLDLKILLLTIPAVFRGDGAR